MTAMRLRFLALNGRTRDRATAHRTSGFPKSTLRLGLVGLLAALVVVPAGSSAPSATRDGDQLRRVNIAIIAVDATAQVMFAKHRGFFAKQGIDAELTVVGDGTLTVPALLSGQAQFAAVPVAVLAILRSRNRRSRRLQAARCTSPESPPRCS